MLLQARWNETVGRIWPADLDFGSCDVSLLLFAGMKPLYWTLLQWNWSHWQKTLCSVLLQQLQGLQRSPQQKNKPSFSSALSPNRWLETKLTTRRIREIQHLSANNKKDRNKHPHCLISEHNNFLYLKMKSFFIHFAAKLFTCFLYSCPLLTFKHLWGWNKSKLYWKSEVHRGFNG